MWVMTRAEATRLPSKHRYRVENRQTRNVVLRLGRIAVHQRLQRQNLLRWIRSKTPRLDGAVGECAAPDGA
jgi:hypothetical protein